MQNIEQPIEVTEDSRRFLDAVFQGASPLFLTGKAGTGKSTLLRQLRDSTLRNVAVVAPTGLAALNVGGQTIHSFFRFPVRSIMDEECIKELYGFPRRLFERLQMLIIDEVSMVRVDLMDCIDKFLRKNTRYKDRPFGGVQVLMVGDLFQLPPVLKNGSGEQQILKKTYGTPFFFGAPVFKDHPLQIFELTKVFRQSDNHFVDCLNQIREGGDNFIEAIRQINANCYIGSEENVGVTMVGTNSQADAINTVELNRLPGDPWIQVATRSGVLAGEAVSENRLPAPDKLRLKIGARVIILRNDLTDRLYVNGTTGVVVRLPESQLDTIGIEIDTVSGETVNVSIPMYEWQQCRVVLDEYEGKYTQSVVGTFEQFPVQLAYAITIHRSQGKTLESVLLDTGRGMFADGQLYVALSRVKSMAGLKLRKQLDWRDVMVNADVVSFYERHHNTQAIQGGLF